jgi:hypothetical protein
MYVLVYRFLFFIFFTLFFTFKVKATERKLLTSKNSGSRTTARITSSYLARRRCVGGIESRLTFSFYNLTACCKRRPHLGAI